LLKIFYDQSFAEHDTGWGHPESADRLKAIFAVIESDYPENLSGGCSVASREELLLIHSETYLNYIESIQDDRIVMLDPDTAFSPGTKKAALKAAGVVIDAVKLVVADKNYSAFCAVRPPGHHAETDHGQGFCVFNNIAVGAATYLARHPGKKVLILDWDVHHGNGTQNMFYSRGDVMYISLHQFPFYPGTGSAIETGTGQGEGYTLNIPMPAGSGDQDYLEKLDEIILPAAVNFRPDLLMISAGFDGHRDDHLAGINLSSVFFGVMTDRLVKPLKPFCENRVVSVLEGGYNYNSLKESLTAHLKVLANE